ncbi:MAG: PD-(D/E)XK nuclease family protein [candidate division WOR-3 bacterium]|nr:PD-(D/E)XK nuclease family protein [candidate division WOR-3 bacterium]
MEGKIKIIPIDQPFLKVLAEYFVDRFSDRLPDFSSILVIFPTERNKFYFRRYLLDAAQTRAVIPPRMMTIEELIDFIYEKLKGERAAILQTIERNFILKKTIDELKIKHWQEIPFLKFISIGNRLLNFYDELSQERVSIEEIEKKSLELHFSERYIKNELPILKEVYQRYRENLSRLGYKDNIDRIEKIYRDFNPEVFREFSRIVIAGIAAATSFEKFILKNLLESLPAELILHSGSIKEIASSDDTHKKFYLHNQLLNYLKVDAEKLIVINGRPVYKPVIHVKALETITKQTFYLGDIVRSALNKYPDLHRIGIVLTDEMLLFPITEILNFHNIEYNISAGLPFTNLIFYSFLKHLYDAVINNLHYTEFFTFIQHPLIKNAVVNNIELKPLVYSLRKEMIEKKKRYFQTTEKPTPQLQFDKIGSGFDPLIKLLSRCFETVTQEVAFDEYMANLIRLLNDILSCNQEVIKGNFPGMREFLERLHNLATLRIEQGAIPSGIGTLEFILRILKDGKYHIEGEPLRGIQIIGVLEARNLDFDCIILPSMNEGIFPRKSEKDIFLNPGLRKAVGLITEEERTNLYYYYFTQLISGKKEIFISYIAEEKMDVPSRFLIMPESIGFVEDKQRIVFNRSAIRIKERFINKDTEILKALSRRIKEGLSHTLLRCYKSCPYQFCLSYLLQIKEPEAIPETFDARIWGALFHDLVKELYKNHYPNGYTDGQKMEVMSKIEEIFEGYLNSGRYVALPLKPEVRLDAFLYKRFLRNFVEKEIARFKEGYEIYKGSEERFLKDIILLDNENIPIIGFVDRVDKKDGLCYIIDYKTGDPPAKKTYEIGEEFIEFQLPIYALMWSRSGQEKIGGLIYYSVGEKVELKEICSKKDVGEYLSEFREKILIPTIKEMIDPDIPFYQTREPNSCRYCGYNILCGKYRWME